MLVPRLTESPYSLIPYIIPKLTVFASLRCKGVTELNGTEKEESVSKKIKEKAKAARPKKAKTSKKKEEVAI